MQAVWAVCPGVLCRVPGPGVLRWKRPFSLQGGSWLSEQRGAAFPSSPPSLAWRRGVASSRAWNSRRIFPLPHSLRVLPWAQAPGLQAGEGPESRNICWRLAEQEFPGPHCVTETPIPCSPGAGVPRYPHFIDVRGRARIWTPVGRERPLSSLLTVRPVTSPGSDGPAPAAAPPSS